ncbi:MAG: alkaline phosphatase family protein [Gammaproteobacteria bacterium]|nr:alkaline phosphatase family protein [Gammaproteobacteria bacterium]
MSLFKTCVLCVIFGLGVASAGTPKVIIFVWDGMRPDAISQRLTPNLYALTQAGTYFANNHSTYPSFTMMNASTFATGDFAGKTGFFGNTLWNPKAIGADSSGRQIAFSGPVFTEDYQILQDLNSGSARPLVYVNTLFNLAHAAGLKTATVGKSGPAFFQDYQQKSGMNGIVFDEKHAYPADFVAQLQQAEIPLPIATSKQTEGPTAWSPVVTLKDGITSDPSATQVSPFSVSNQYMMQVYLTQILPKEEPALSVVWMRNPDTTEHAYGVGSQSMLSAVAAQDQLLGQLITRLKALHEWGQTDLIIVSDHGHSSVSGPLNLFPLRGIHEGMVGDVDPHGYSVSGGFRPADLLTRAGFKAYDGLPALYAPVLSGIKADGQAVYPTVMIKDVPETTPAYFVPNPLPHDAIVVAENGGSTYFYVPDHNRTLVAKLVRYLQSREEFDAIFVNDQYGILPGVFPMSLVRLLNPERRSPAVIAGSSYDANAVIQGFKGIEFNSSFMERGMHGSFSPIDVHNTLVAIGPDFKTHFVDTLPTGNVDVPVTVAYLLHLKMPGTDGRPLLEALQNGEPLSAYQVKKQIYNPVQPAKNLSMILPANPDGKDIDPGLSHYTIHLQVEQLTLGGYHDRYFDWAKADRY